MKGDYVWVNGAVTLISDLRITSYDASRQCFFEVVAAQWCNPLTLQPE